MIVDGAGHFEIGMSVRLLDDVAGPRANLVVEWDQPIRLQILRQFLWVLIPAACAKESAPGKRPVDFWKIDVHAGLKQVAWPPIGRTRPLRAGAGPRLRRTYGLGLEQVIFGIAACNL